MAPVSARRTNCQRGRDRRQLVPSPLTRENRMRLRSPGPSTAWPRLLWAAATVLLLQSPTVTPAFAHSAAPQPPAGRQAGALPPVPVPRPVPSGGAHLGDVALPVAGTPPAVIPPSQPGNIQAPGTPSPPPPPARNP